MSYTFPKSARLRTRQDFRTMKSARKRLVGRNLCIDIRSSKAPRLGITASSKYGDAHERNRFKRLIREAFRLSYPQCPNFDIHVVPRQLAKTATLCDISTELTKLLKDA